MARATYVMRDGVLVDKQFARPLASANPTAYVISDTMKEAAAHPCTGVMMDSKAQFRRVTRENGCVEIGTEKMPGQPYEVPHGEIARELARHY